MFEALKYWRKSEDLTQKEIAEKLGVARSTYAGWETGKDFMPLPRLKQFANIFHISLDSLVGIASKSTIATDSYPIDPKLVGEKLKKVRLSHHLTQEQFASSIKTSQANIHKYEKGESLITTYYALEFAKQYNYSLDELIKKDENN